MSLGLSMLSALIFALSIKLTYRTGYLTSQLRCHRQFKFNMSVAVALMSPVHSYSDIQYKFLSLFVLLAKV